MLEATNYTAGVRTKEKEQKRIKAGRWDGMVGD
jgi:hypothetical protein